jgi:hypothetical protein
VRIVTLDDVRRLHPGWECWCEPVPMNGWYYAGHEEVGRVSAADPEDLHFAILRAEENVPGVEILPWKPENPLQGLTDA